MGPPKQGRCRIVLLLMLLCQGLIAGKATSQEIQVVDRFQQRGRIEAISPGRLSLRTKGGELYKLKLQDPKARFIELNGGQTLRLQAKVKVIGELPLDRLTAGDRIRCRIDLNQRGGVGSKLSELTLVDAKSTERGVTFDEPPTSRKTKSPALIVGDVVKRSRKRLVVRLGKSTTISREEISLPLTKETVLGIESSDLGQVRAGDEVTALQAVKLNTDDLLVGRIEIRLMSNVDRTATVDDELERKHRRLSDAPSPPRDVRSRNFLLHTDISDRSAAILLDKLERMAGLISKYFGAAPRGPIECYVVRDMSQWVGAPIPPAGRAKILEPAGVTLSRSLGRQRESIVYSCDDHGTVQHEAVHAFCYLTFGSTGPTWYSEGMAEMGAYWKEGQKEVDVHPIVMRYLKNSEPKRLLDIVAAGQVTGDSWEAYAWRWALCHLLANNPNYSDRFLGLGVDLMRKGKQTFETVYGPVAKEISFEYDQFTQNVDNGYRADLCAWPWKAKFQPLRGSRTVKQKIRADRGWQASGARVEQGVLYQVAAQGEWRTASAGEPLSADGDPAGPGRLIGVVMNNYQLSGPFELAAKTKFTVPTSGNLYLRCRDDWSQLADNRGELTVHLRKAPAESGE